MMIKVSSQISTSRITQRFESWIKAWATVKVLLRAGLETVKIEGEL